MANQRPLSVTPEVPHLYFASAALDLKLGLASPVHTRDAMGKRDGKAAKAKRAERRGKGSLKTEQKTAIAEGKQERKKAFAKDEEDLDALQHVRVPTPVPPGCSTRLGRAPQPVRSQWRLMVRPKVRAEFADSTAFDHAGAAQGVCERAGQADGGQGGGDATALAAIQRHAHRPPDQGRAHLLRRRAPLRKAAAQRPRPLRRERQVKLRAASSLGLLPRPSWQIRSGRP